MTARQLVTLVAGLLIGRALGFILAGDGPHYSNGGKPARPATMADVEVEPLISDQGVAFRITKSSGVGPARVLWSWNPETRTVTDVSVSAPPSTTPQG